MVDKPFIKLFRTPNAFYFLDVNKNEIIPISEEAHRYLYGMLANGKNGSSIPDELAGLKKAGYLSTESAVQELQHAYTDDLALFLDRKLQKITLQLTQNCNFRCKYCVYTEKPKSRQRSHSLKRMDWETAREAVDFLWHHSVDSPRVNIGFYGGEPLFEFQLLKRVVEYSEKRFAGKDLSFNITTNGTLVNREIALFFQLHNINVMVSLDGPKEINDKNRVFVNGKGTYDAVTHNIARVLKTNPDFIDRLQISMVLDPENDFDCINNIFLEGGDFNSLNFQASLIDHEFDDEISSVSEEYKWKYEYQHFLAILANVGRFPKDKVSPIALQAMASVVQDLEKIGRGSGLKPRDAPSGPCIPGQMRLFVDVSGRLFPCERVSETSSAMCIGTLHTGFNLDKADQILNIGRLTENECKKCWCFRYCTQCVKKAVGDCGELSAETRLLHCDETKASVYYKILQFILLKELPIYYSDQLRNDVRQDGH